MFGPRYARDMPTTIDHEFLEEFASRWLDAWNSHDTDQVLSLLSPDVTWDERTFWPEVIHGHDAVRGYTDAVWQAMPGVRFEEIGRFFDPYATRGIVLFHQTGRAPEKLGSDRRFAAHGCDIFLEFKDGLLSHYMSSYDMVGMMIQLDLLPPKDGRLGGSYLRSLMGAPA